MTVLYTSAVKYGCFCECAGPSLEGPARRFCGVEFEKSGAGVTEYGLDFAYEGAE